MSEWISVKDRLPEKGQKVLAVVRGEIDYGYIESIIYYDDYLEEEMQEFHWHGHEMHNNEALNALTYWMPLPEAPKE